MNLNQLTKVTDRSAKRLGRGLGSGKGKTAGRGQKGQKARGKIPAANVGAGIILYKKLPYRRGWSRTHGNPPRSPKAIIVQTKALNALKAKSVVNITTLVESGLIKQKEVNKFRVKILNSGEISIPLTIEIPVSKSVKEAVEKAGGKVV
jgi:large subunit ribosomal protein L15